MMTRRDFLHRSTLLSTATLAAPALRAADAASAPQPALACNQYVWQVFYQREGKNLGENLDVALGEMAAAGLNGFEPMINTPEDVARLAPLLTRHGLAMRSLYVNSTLHEADLVQGSIDQILAIGRAAQPLGTRIVVTNPSPIRWGGPENKDDAQLRTQAAAMNRLGAELARLGLQLAYHNHDIELRQAAREFHHMMAGTNPEVVHLCLDAHWIYRGSGNSSVALFDVVKLYGPRVRELHLRQSRDGVWTESFGAGDIDYGRLVADLAALRLRPHLVLEQAVESGTPHTLNALEAHRAGVAYARREFAALA